jgi:hypothetical protein
MTSIKYTTASLPQGLSSVKTKIISDHSLLSRELNSIKNQSEKVIFLSQQDFKHGTVIINCDSVVSSVNSEVILNIKNTSGYTFRLTEDIDFNPTNYEPETVSRTKVATIGKPSKGFGTHYPYDQYGIGFFAAIAVSAKNVVIDLNGHTLRQSSSHKLTQRFFACIETANQPFIPGVGPHTFGSSFKSCDRVMICNGTLGQSAHHGIHGNNQTNLIVHDVDFKNYEVSASSLNGGEHISFTNCRMLGSDQAIPTLGVFSSLMFVQPYIEHLKVVGTGPEGPLAIKCYDSAQGTVRQHVPLEVHDRVLDDMWAVYNAVINKVGEVPGQYDNYVGSVDGRGYGVSFNKEKPTVGPFPETRSGVPGKYIYMKDCNLSNHVSWVNEVPAIMGLGPVNDQTGAIVQTDQKWRVLESQEGPNQGAFDSSRGIIALAQFMVAKYRDMFPPQLNTQRISILPPLISRFEEGQTFMDRPKIWNGDSMHHTNKGVVAIKCDACEDIYLTNVKVENTQNVTPVYSRFYDDDQYTAELTSEWSVTPDEYKYKSRLASQAGSSIYGGQSQDVRGMSLASSNNVIVENVSISNTHSTKGRAIGIDAFFDTTNVSISNSQVYNVTGSAGVDLGDITCDANPIQLNDAIGVHVGGKTRFVSLDLEINGKVEGLTASDALKVD